MRSPDRFGRFGGDEFLIVLPETGAEATAAMIERLGAALRSAVFEVRGERIALSASFGQVRFRPGESLQTLLGRVDECLYDAKAARPAGRQAIGPGSRKPA
jgi:diguanylate cyclase (GGDEF)-like protein